MRRDRDWLGRRHNIWVLSHLACTIFKPPTKASLIRICSVTDDDTYGFSHFKQLIFPEHYRDILHLKFDDVEIDGYGVLVSARSDGL